MRVPDNIAMPENVDEDRIARLEERIARVEAHLGFTPSAAVSGTPIPPPGLAPVFGERTTTREEFEFELGQHWFELAGIIILTTGVAFLLSLPYSDLPAAIPSLAGFALVGALFVAGYLCPPSFVRAAVYLHGAAMTLLGFSSLRLFLFGVPALEINGTIGRVILCVVTVVNVIIAIRRQSPWLTGLALAITSGIAITVGAPSLVLLSTAAIAMVTVAVSRRRDWPMLLLVGIFLTYATYFAWATGNPFRTGEVHFVNAPTWAPAVVLAMLMLLGATPLLRARQSDDAPTNVAAFANCTFGYGVFLLHTAASFRSQFAGFHTAAAIALLGLAMAFFVRTQSRASTFFYAMTGYAALSFAILKLSSAPDVFVWLSVQSVVVVATAIWFRSRFIVVANFFIFVAIVATYVALTTRESGISIGFGLVALVTARILNWQQHRLELKTEFMRNAYLTSAFVIFPYAIHHLVAARYVALGWTALAAAYYVMNLAVQNQKYRWMGHGTLILTTIYVVGAGVSRFEPVYRVLSFLVLGTTLLTVSLLFARARRRQTLTGDRPGNSPPAT